MDLLKASRPAAPPLDPHFRTYLRAKLMSEAQRTLQPRAARPSFPFSLKPKVLAPMMAAVAAGFLVVLGVEIYLQRRRRDIMATPREQRPVQSYQEESSTRLHQLPLPQIAGAST